MCGGDQLPLVAPFNTLEHGSRPARGGGSFLAAGSSLYLHPIRIPKRTGRVNSDFSLKPSRQKECFSYQAAACLPEGNWRSRTRTYDQAINSRSLYQLSYTPLWQEGPGSSAPRILFHISKQGQIRWRLVEVLHFLRFASFSLGEARRPPGR